MLAGGCFGLAYEQQCTILILSCWLLQSWHWGEKRRLSQYYSDLYKRERADEEAYSAELRSKLKALEEELLA